jgi:hypothetical protein
MRRLFFRVLITTVGVLTLTAGVVEVPAYAAGLPTVASVSPASGNALGGTVVTVTGTNFTGATATRFGTTAGTSVRVSSATRLTVTTPRHAPGVVDVRVVTPAGTSAIVTADRFTFVDTTAPAPATGLGATVSGTRVGLDWTNPTATDFSGVMIRRAPGAVPPASPTDGTLVTDTAKTATSFTDPLLTATTQYSYALFAHDVSKNFAPAVTTTVSTTTTDATAPRAVTSVTTTLSGTSIGLQWTNPTDADFYGVTIRRAAGTVAPASPTAGTLIANTKKSATSYIDKGLAVGTTYTYALFAHDVVPNFGARATTASVRTAAAKDTTPPAPVTAVTSTATENSITLTWKNPTTADMFGVMIRRAAGATPPASATAGTLVADTSRTATSFTDTGLSPSTQYAYALFAHDAGPNNAGRVTTTRITLAGADTTPPGPVAALSAVPASASIALAWTNPTDADFAGVMIRRASGTSPPSSPTVGTLVTSTTRTATGFTDTGLSPSTQYSYALFARDAVPNYAAAAVVSTATVAAVDMTPPGPVSVVTATPASTSVALNWSNPTDADFAGVMIRRAAGSTPPSSATAGTLVTDTTGTATGFTDTGLSPSTQYSYALFAHDAVPNYATAVTRVVTTLAAPDTTPPGPVTSVGSTATATSVALSWTNPTDADFAGVMIRRASGSTPPSSATAGTLVTDTSGTATGFTDTGLSPATQYSYALFAHDAVPNHATAATRAVTTLAAPDTTPPGSVTSVTGTSTGSTVGLSWTNPPDADFAGVMIRRATGSTPPSSATAGTLVTDTSRSATGFTDTGLSPSTKYSYALFAHDAVPNYATAATTTSTTGCSRGPQHVSGALTGDTSWATNECVSLYVLDGDVTVPSGSTLTVAPGTIVKIASGTLIVEGSLVAAGTAGSPVLFTSLRDDSIGGDANGDGTSTQPTPGDWNGISTSGPGSSVSLDHVGIRYGYNGVNVPGARSAVITNSIVEHSSNVGIYVGDSAWPSPTNELASVTIAGNTVTRSGGLAIHVANYSYGLDLRLVNLQNNTGSGNAAGNYLQLDSWRLRQDETWGFGSGALPTVLAYGTQVPAGTSLTIPAGSLLKFASPSWTTFTVDGSLIAAGSAASPVVFTSVKDDTVGGDTNGDGNRTQPAAGDWSGISTSGTASTIALDRVDIRYASTGVSTGGSASTSITNSSVKGSAGTGIYVGDNGWPSATNQLASVTLSGNTVTGSGGVPIEISDYGYGLDLRLANLQNNIGSGNAGGNYLRLDGWRLRQDETWGFGPGSLPVVLTYGTHVPVGMTLTIPAGSVLKFTDRWWSSFTVEGALIAAGSSASPVVFTSVKDDSVGGDVNADGTSTKPTAGDWSGISTSGTGSTISLDHVDVRYASTGINVSGSGVTSITNSAVQHSAGTGIFVGDNGWPSPSNQLASVTVTGNRVTDSGEVAIDISDYSYGLDLRLANLQSNTGSGNAGGNYLQLNSWRLRQDETWGFGPGALPVVLTYRTDVPAGTTLTIPAGSLLKFANPWAASFTIEGSLIAAGSAASPVVFTSVKDDTIGGDVNADGSTSSPRAGDWYGISTSGTDSTISLDHVDVRYASTGVNVSGSASTSITSSTVAHSAGEGIAVDDSGWPSRTNQLAAVTVRGNSVTDSGAVPIRVSNSSYGLDLRLANLQNNTGSGNNGGNYLRLDSWRLGQDETWGFGTGALPVVLTYGTDVPTGTTLTIPAGSLLKFANPWRTSFTVEGSLVAAGSSAAPVVFTSVMDDSAGGDTNADGTSTKPRAGDWSGISSSGTGSTIALDHVDVRYASTGVTVSGSGVTSITSSTVQHSAGEGIAVNDSGWPSRTDQLAAVTVRGNSVTDSGAVPIHISNYSYGLDLRLASVQNNTGSANASGNYLQVDGWRLRQDETWGFGSGALPVVLSYGTDVPAGTTLTIPAGSILKFANPYYSSLTVEGSLIAAGTAAAPVIFTSVKDDTVGGDTNGDGHGSQPAAGDWSGISTSGTGARLSLDHADIRYASYGVTAPGAVSTSITNSSVKRSAGTGIFVGDDGWPSATGQLAAVTVRGNTVTDSGAVPIRISDANYGMDLRLANLQSNTGSGNNGGNYLQLESWRLRQNETWGFGSGALPAVLTYATDVPAGMTLTIPASSVLKFTNYSYGSFTVEGSLVTAGTSTSPVVFTSLRDDSVRGDTNGDASGSTPIPGDWAGIDVRAEGNANLQGTTIRYASTALNVADSATATMRGRILDTLTGISSNTYVDATDVDWGDPSGPSPIGTGTPISGSGVDVLPWVGWVAPQLPPPAPAGTTPDASAGCKQVMFLAVRGSGEDPYERSDDLGYSSWLDGFGYRTWKVYNGFTARMEQGGYSSENYKGIGLRYTAMHVPSLDNDAIAFASYDYNKSIWEGVDRIEQYLRDEHSRCSAFGQKYVLAGYSQGALAIHIYLTQRAPANILNEIVAVGLVADPAKNANGAEQVYSDGFLPAGDNMKGAQGIYARANLPGDGALPSEVVRHTVTMCHDKDLVCAPGWHSSKDPHSSYGQIGTEMQDMGKWLADTVISSSLPSF